MLRATVSIDDLECAMSSASVSIEAELERFSSGYWTFTPAGVPSPAFLNDLLKRDAEYLADRIRLAGPVYEILFALEMEHRACPICTIADVEAALDRIESLEYDFGPSRALNDVLLAAVRVVNW